MNGRVAKRLRRLVYGERGDQFSLREKRKYATNRSGTAIINTGRRAEYLKLKREHKRTERR